ncbi:hypothetical protein K0B96_00815 [Horticoccus luteus]|uniref:Uncharacterized protein n=1 Tax=Horticoccus luteus TaxID=2862869 RepID=A0A8F9TWN5_9BACT|nr:hypothetical protein [Horticoccus luteus]QYM79189.1 hypothetical protein K0B96_00815 [Horticoccus luteus]
MEGYAINEWWGHEGETFHPGGFTFDSGEQPHGEAFVLVFEHQPGVGVVYLFFGSPGDSRGKQLSESEAARLREQLPHLVHH